MFGEFNGRQPLKAKSWLEAFIKQASEIHLCLRRQRTQQILRNISKAPVMLNRLAFSRSGGSHFLQVMRLIQGCRLCLS